MTVSVLRPDTAKKLINAGRLTYNSSDISLISSYSNGFIQIGQVLFNSLKQSLQYSAEQFDVAQLVKLNLKLDIKKVIN